MELSMELAVTSGALATLRKEAQLAAPNEACGLLLGQGGVIESAQLCANVAPNPARHFEIDPVALIAAHKAEREGGAQLIGYWHSHPNGLAEPSATDREKASGDGRVWAILAGEGVTFWRDTIEGFEALPSRLIEG